MGKKRALRLLVSSFLYCSGYNLFTELYNDLAQQPEWIKDSTGKITGYRTPGGADTVFPFSSISEFGTISVTINANSSQYTDVYFKQSYSLAPNIYVTPWNDAHAISYDFIKNGELFVGIKLKIRSYYSANRSYNITWIAMEGGII